MASEKSSKPGDVEAATEAPKFNGTLEHFWFGARRSSRLNNGADTASTAPQPASSPAPKRKAARAPAVDASSSAAAPTPRKKARTRIPGKKGPGYASPEKYAHLDLLPDTLEDGLICAFVGLNPGITTAAQGHAYAHPSNLFWRLLHSSGLTPRRFKPSEDRSLPALCSLGNTNIVARPTRDQSELSKTEMDASVSTLLAKLHRFRPEAVCIVGKGIWESMYRTKYGRPVAKGAFHYGWQPGEDIGVTRVFVATTTSGLAASLSLEEKERIWRVLGDWVQTRRAQRAEGKTAGEGEV
ncbi:MAG: hypothetical protein M1839_007718 [Geoglossum umbratile]|nr:MAG: hypothetical protein M1839_007718 [Geoglossum umbratile]